ncbi:hypothetical protein Ndes2437A_g00524 [Nannochloris sp. 'desiccata']
MMYPAFGLRRSGEAMKTSTKHYSSSTTCRAHERCLQRCISVALMVLDFLHRRAVAAVTVDAPASLVWEVLTDYDHLADFIPNLAASERIKLPPSAPANVVRVRQVGYKTHDVHVPTC